MSAFRKALLPTIIARVILYSFAILFGVFLTYVFIILLPVLVFMAFFYLIISWVALKDRIRLLFVLIKVYYYEKRDKVEALRLLNSEIYDNKELLKAEKSEMDTHRLNTRNEADSMRYAKRGENEIRANLGFLTHLHKLLISSMKKEPSSAYEIDLDRY